MKARGKVVVIAVFLMAFMVSTPILGVNHAFADAVVSKAKVKQVGYNAQIGRAKVVLEDMAPGPQKQWTGDREFYFSTALTNQGLATSLTAFANGSYVYVYLAAITPGSLIINIYAY